MMTIMMMMMKVITSATVRALFLQEYIGQILDSLYDNAINIQLIQLKEEGGALTSVFASVSSLKRKY